MKKVSLLLVFLLAGSVLYADRLSQDFDRLSDTVPQGYQFIVLCEEDPFPDPAIPYCGQYVDTIFGGASSGCDSTVLYDIAFMRADVKIILPRRSAGNKVIAEVMPACDRIMPDYTGTWIDRQSGAVLAHDTFNFDVKGPGQYCFLLQAEYQGQVCPPQTHCFTIKGSLTAPPELTTGN